MRVSNALQVDPLIFSGKASLTPAAREDVTGGMTRSTIINLALAATKRQITSLGSLEQNWDTYGSTPPTRAAVAKAQQMLGTIYAEVLNAGLPWKSPHLTASEKGEVVFEWWKDSKKLSVYLGDLDAEYIKVWGPNIATEMSDGPLTDENIAELWTWLSK